LADLVDNFPVTLGRVHRVVFSRPDWDTAPHRVRVARGQIKVGSYPHSDTHQVWLSMSTNTMIRLSVTAADGSAQPPAPGPGHTPPAAADTSPEQAHDADSPWSDDGDSWWGSHPIPPSERI